MKIPTTFLNRVLRNEGLQVSVAVERDEQEIAHRFEHEGMSFLTITLPSLDDALVQGLAKGRIAPAMFEGFQPFRRGGKLPALLSGFFMRVFELDGSLKDDPCIDSIRAIRQVTRLFKKIELPCSSARVKQAFERYRTNDESIDGTASNPGLLRRVAGYLWSDLEGLSGELYCSPGIFGSGAAAERVAFNERHSIKCWPARAEPWFPLAYHTSHREDDIESFRGVEVIPPDEELPVRVVGVPKTLKTPRVISVEPSYMMLMQQSIAKPLMAYLESELFQYQSIRFTDQTVNRDLARIGSRDGSLATIDLKDASDMVSNDLVKGVFSVAPSFLELIQACRSTRARLPDSSVITLQKFASQGSAMCFPIEAMVFLTIILYSGVRQSGRRLSRQLLLDITANVSVYGDDIIVPTEMAAGVMEDLEAFGLKVNHDKSFVTGFFRESCGGDYYKGVDVTPSYVRTWDFTGNSRDPRTLLAYVSLSNQFYMKGLWHVSQYLRDHVQSIHGPIQTSTRPVGVVTWASVSSDSGLTYDVTTSGWRLKGLCVRVGRKEDPVLDIRAGMLVCMGAGALRDNIRGMLASREQNSEVEIFRSLRGDSMALGYCKTAGGQSRDNLFVQWSRDCLPLEVGADKRNRLGWYDKPSDGNVEHLKSGLILNDLTASVDSYVSNTKRRWTPTQVGLPGW